MPACLHHHTGLAVCVPVLAKPKQFGLKRQVITLLHVLQAQ
jgi:hypothetical protein